MIWDVPYFQISGFDISWKWVDNHESSSSILTPGTKRKTIYIVANTKKLIRLM